MIIERDRYLDDSAHRLITLGVRSRSPEMHSVLTALTAEQRAAVADALARALEDIAAVLRAKLEEGEQ